MGSYAEKYNLIVDN